VSRLRWTATGECGWTSTNGLYRLEQNPATKNWFVYRVTHSANAATGNGHWDALLGARYDLASAKRHAQEHYDSHGPVAGAARRQAP
jgi:hypothetical protein